LLVQSFTDQLLLYFCLAFGKAECSYHKQRDKNYENNTPNRHNTVSRYIVAPKIKSNAYSKGEEDDSDAREHSTTDIKVGQGVIALRFSFKVRSESPNFP